MIQQQVPLHFVGEDECGGVKLGGGIVSHNLTEVEISCLPADLPEYLEVFVAELDLGQTIHLSELALPEGVTIPALIHSERDVTVVGVQIPRGGAEEEEEEAAAAAAALEEGIEGEEGEEGEKTSGDATDEDAGEKASDD